MNAGEILTEVLKGKIIRTGRVSPPWSLRVDEVRIGAEGSMVLYDNIGGYIKTDAGQFEFEVMEAEAALPTPEPETRIIAAVTVTEPKGRKKKEDAG